MTSPTDTPGAAITRAAARHKAATDATKALAATLEQERRTPPENAPPDISAPRP